MKKPPDKVPHTPTGDRLCFVAGAVFFIGAAIGGLMNLYEAGIEKGRRKQFVLDKERAEKKGFEL